MSPDSTDLMATLILCLVYIFYWKYGFIYVSVYVYNNKTNWPKARNFQTNGNSVLLLYLLS